MLSEEIENKTPVDLIEKKVQQLEDEGNYGISISICNTSEWDLENLILYEKIPQNFHYGELSQEPSEIQHFKHILRRKEINTELLVWRIEILPPGQEIQISYVINNIGDIKTNKETLFPSKKPFAFKARVARKIADEIDTEITTIVALENEMIESYAKRSNIQLAQLVMCSFIQTQINKFKGEEILKRDVLKEVKSKYGEIEDEFRGKFDDYLQKLIDNNFIERFLYGKDQKPRIRKTTEWDEQKSATILIGEGTSDILGEKSEVKPTEKKKVTIEDVVEDDTKKNSFKLALKDMCSFIDTKINKFKGEDILKRDVLKEAKSNYAEIEEEFRVHYDDYLQNLIESNFVEKFHKGKDQKPKIRKTSEWNEQKSAQHLIEYFVK